MLGVYVESYSKQEENLKNYRYFSLVRLALPYFLTSRELLRFQYLQVYSAEF